MTGIDKICEKILAKAHESADEIAKDAQKEADKISESYARLAQKEVDEILVRGRKSAAEHEARLDGAARLNARNLHLKAKQEMISRAFDAALDRLCKLPEDQYVSILARLAAESSVSGNEEILLSPNDRAAFGKKVLSKANKLINTHRPDSFPELKRPSLTLSEETRDIRGGVILVQDKIEINASFEVLIRDLRNKLSAQVADILFNRT